VSKDFTNASLQDVIDYLQTELQMVVLVDNEALAEVNVNLADPISDRLDSQPFYLLLQRLEPLEVRWYVQNEVLHLTSPTIAAESTVTQTYNIGHLLDAGYAGGDLTELLERTISPDSWSGAGGTGNAEMIGDVLFILQTPDVQREVQGLLSALQEHGRRTFIADPPQNVRLRDKLRDQVSIDWKDEPLETAVAQLAELTQADIRLDTRALREARIRERSPITLKLNGQPLSIVLSAMTKSLQLTTQINNGVLWVTSKEAGEPIRKTAVYDVRDLCRDGDESSYLAEALESQAGPDEWQAAGGLCDLEFAKPGVLVVIAHDQQHETILTLLEAYRMALRESKPRASQEPSPDEVVTVYYRLDSQVAESLAKLLPTLVDSDTWRSPNAPEASGTITLINSSSELWLNGKRVRGGSLASEEDKAGSVTVVAKSVLVIRQTRATHTKLKDIMRRVESGDWSPDDIPSTFGMGGMGGSGGGFGGNYGGGFFDVEPTKSSRRSDD
jgi:hypothetical protein